MPNLSKRLKAVAEFVPKGKSVCDVGTDHGFLPAALYLSGEYSKITATDIREKPLENAKKNLDRFGVKGVNLILCDGLSAVEKQDAETVIIAGMGGEVISGIIDRCPYKNSSVFILQPMTDAETLREYLALNGFAVKKEKAVCDNGKIYSVMKAEYDGKIKKLSLTEQKIGRLKPDSEDNIKYIKKQLDICNKCVSDLQKSGIKSEMFILSKKVSKELLKILSAK